MTYGMQFHFHANLQIKVIFIRMVSHIDSFWNRGKKELGSGLFQALRDIKMAARDLGVTNVTSPHRALKIWVKHFSGNRANEKTQET